MLQPPDKAAAALERARRHARLLDGLRAFVQAEREAAQEKLFEVWRQPLADRLSKGLSQRFLKLEPGPEQGTLWAYVDDGESRFREGDLVCLHGGSPLTSMLAREAAFEAEDEERWLLRVRHAGAVVKAAQGAPCYADPDDYDLSRYYDEVLDDIGQAIPPSRAHRYLMPLLDGRIDDGFDPRDFEEGEAIALAAGLNAAQAEAVGKIVAAEQVACIQGPPGTGKTRVLALAARMLVERGERVLVTSHTHMAINNALNKIAAQGVKTAKIGRATQALGLDGVTVADSFGEWHGRPEEGYVVGATPFATCTYRLENCEFDTVIFDEASQVTLPLALMAMRRGARFVFIGDQKQLPPVLLARSILEDIPGSIFAKLTLHNVDSVMLTDTYRLNRELAAWPSNSFYGGRLRSAGPNRERKLVLAERPDADCFDAVLRAPASAVYLPTRDPSARSRNPQEAQLVASLCAAAIEGGLAPREIGIVTPFRAHGRTVRRALAERLGWHTAREIVADTVERMQGQERELVILSLATGNLRFLAAIAGFFFQPERLNVSVTRAMTKLVILGPELPPDFRALDPVLAGWLALYRGLLAQAQRIEL
ncbi:AAA domain-containing protein [Massilia sp.]|uniref:DEAD/DEAH box helicase n=1 Tax=Massilia sp. TaxID=1882437 RepID=UPI0028A93215|nr:AAA domain-containing protein [Massilia sp.]